MTLAHEPPDALTCDCGYVCRGTTDDERVDDAVRHARQAHGIEVRREQVVERL
jgi:predicted small metal-binding protein